MSVARRVRRAVSLYRILLRVYPGESRRAYGRDAEEMVPWRSGIRVDDGRALRSQGPSEVAPLCPGGGGTLSLGLGASIALFSLW